MSLRKPLMKKRKQNNVGFEERCHKIRSADKKKKQIMLNITVEPTSADDTTNPILTEVKSRLKIPITVNKQKTVKGKRSSKQSTKYEEKRKVMQLVLDKLYRSFMSKRAVLADTPNLENTAQRIAQLCRKYSLEIDSSIFSTDKLRKKKPQLNEKKYKETCTHMEETNKRRKSRKPFILYIDNLPPKTTEIDIKIHFNQAGHIHCLRPPSSKGNCTLAIRSKGVFLRALEMNHTLMHGNVINVVNMTKGTESGQLSLFVGNLPWDAALTSIVSHFKEGGAEVEVTKLGPTGFCHLKVKNDEAYNKALQMNHTIINGKRIRVDRLRSQYELIPKRVQPLFHNVNKKYVLFVGHLPLGTSRENILEHFSVAGSMSIISDPGLRGYCLLDTKNKETYLKALSMNGTVMQNDVISVEKLGGKLNTHKSKADIVTVPARDRRHVFSVNDLRWDTTREDILQHFSEVGEVTIVSGLGHKGYCLLNAENEETYIRALEMDQTFLNKQQIKVGRAFGSLVTNS